MFKKISYYDEEHIWPSEKLYRYLVQTFFENKNELMIYKAAPKFVPAGQSTQMIIGATGETDYEIMSVTEALYNRFELKRVFYSAFVNVNCDETLPSVLQGPPLKREHRLYQADFLMRFYAV